MFICIINDITALYESLFKNVKYFIEIYYIIIINMNFFITFSKSSVGKINLLEFFMKITECVFLK